jgi:MFS transporter, FLVCR family, MFS-domain-containing protein 7
MHLTVQGALRAGKNANPPLNMHKALIFTGVVVVACSSLVFVVQGKQARKELDEEKHRAQDTTAIAMTEGQGQK